MLLQALGLDDDYLLEQASPQRRTWTCCLLLLILLTKRTITHLTISLDTAKRYVHAYASLCAMALDIDVRKTLQTDAHSCLEYRLLCADQKRWEEDPERKEPWTVDMSKNLDAWCDATGQTEDSIASVCSDWFIVGLYTGHRKSEWAQPDSAHATPADHLREDDEIDLPRAFIKDDITFFTRNKKPIPTDQLLAMPDHQAMRLIGIMGIRWRTQKNGQRNQTIHFTPNTKSPALCCIRRMLRILRRHHRLSDGRPNLPLSLFRAENGQVFNVIDRNIEKVMRATVARWANLDPSNPKHAAVLKRWSLHSLRVGATNLLYADGFSDHQIMVLLRWRSFAFMTYFRNLAIVSDKQNNAIFQEDVMVNLF